MGLKLIPLYFEESKIDEAKNGVKASPGREKK